MTAKDYLEQYKEADRLAKRLEAEYMKELEMIDAVRSTADLDGLPHGTGIKKSVEDRAVRLADKAAEWKMAELDALHIRQEIFETINRVGGEESEVLFERYINLLKWRAVCVQVHWSWSKVDALHKSGLEKISQLIQKKQESAQRVVLL